jgi:hypothetical protein
MVREVLEQFDHSIPLANPSEKSGLSAGWAGVCD